MYFAYVHLLHISSEGRLVSAIPEKLSFPRSMSVMYELVAILLWNVHKMHKKWQKIKTYKCIQTGKLIVQFSIPHKK